MTLVCIPAVRGDDRFLAGDHQAFTANAALLDAFDYTPQQAEEAEYAALVVASVYALAAHGARCVVTAEVGAGQIAAGAETGNGGVVVHDLRRDQLVAFFISPDEQADDVAGASRGLTVDDAWALAPVQALLENELQWHDLSEWSR